jgi:hypothetical protein
MIRINLLAAPKPKSKRGRGAVSAPAVEFGEAGSPVLKVVVAVLLMAAAERSRCIQAPGGRN